jgi:hypothetical protein
MMFMNIYLIAYELNKQEHNESDLIAAIGETSDRRLRCLQSIWIVSSNNDEADIRDALKLHLCQGQKLLVVRLSGEGAWIGFDEADHAWMVHNF